MLMPGLLFVRAERATAGDAGINHVDAPQRGRWHLLDDSLAPRSASTAPCSGG